MQPLAKRSPRSWQAPPHGLAHDVAEVFDTHATSTATSNRGASPTTALAKGTLKCRRRWIIRTDGKKIFSAKEHKRDDEVSSLRWREDKSDDSSTRHKLSLTAASLLSQLEQERHELRVKLAVKNSELEALKRQRNRETELTENQFERIVHSLEFKIESFKTALGEANTTIVCLERKVAYWTQMSEQYEKTIEELRARVQHLQALPLQQQEALSEDIAQMKSRSLSEAMAYESTISSLKAALMATEQRLAEATARIESHTCSNTTSTTTISRDVRLAQLPDHSLCEQTELKLRQSLKDLQLELNRATSDYVIKMTEMRNTHDRSMREARMKHTREWSETESRRNRELGELATKVRELTMEREQLQLASIAHNQVIDSLKLAAKDTEQMWEARLGEVRKHSDAEILSLKASLTSLQQRLEGSETDAREKSLTLSEQEQLVPQLREQVLDLQAKLSAAAKFSKSLQDASETQSEKSAKMQADHQREMLELGSRIRLLESQLSSSQALLQTSEEQWRKNLAVAKASANDTESALRIEVDRLKKALTELETSSSTRHRDIQLSLEKDRDDEIIRLRKQLEQRLADQEASLTKSKDEETSRLRKQLEELRTRLEKELIVTQNELDDRKMSNSRLSDTISELQNELYKIKTAHASQLEHLNSALDDKDREIARLREAGETTAQTSLTRVSELEKTLELLKVQHGEHKAAWEQEEIRKREALIAEHTRSTNDMKVDYGLERQKLQEQIGALEAQVAKLTSSFKVAEEKEDAWTDESKSLRAALEETKVKLEGALKNNSELEALIAALEDEVSKLKSEMAKASEHHEQALAELENMLTEEFAAEREVIVKEQVDIALAQAKQEIKRLKIEMETTSGTIEDSYARRFEELRKRQAEDNRQMLEEMQKQNEQQIKGVKERYQREAEDLQQQIKRTEEHYQKEIAALKGSTTRNTLITREQVSGGGTTTITTKTESSFSNSDS